MGVVQKVLGPRSKYDKSLPYTYFAKIPALPGDDAYSLYYFSDTICGLIEYLDTNGIAPEVVELFGAYPDSDIPIEKARCLSPDGEWLKRPHICRALEGSYQETLEDRYKGHVEIGQCDFDDRDRMGGGPY